MRRQGPPKREVVRHGLETPEYAFQFFRARVTGERVQKFDERLVHGDR
jgi:hypothetical protein